MLNDKDFKVAIVGGGICGLTLAIALSREGVEVELYEAAAKFTETGAGFALGPNSLRVLERLGVLDTLQSHLGQEMSESVWKYFAVGKEGAPRLIYEQGATVTGKQLRLFRYAYLDALVPLLPSHIAHFSKRCIGVSQNSGDQKYTLHFSDGSATNADIVVGADGIKSVIRHHILEGIPTFGTFNGDANKGRNCGGHLSFSGVRTYRGKATVSALKEAGVKLDVDPDATNFYMGENGCIVAYLIDSGRILNLSLNKADPTVPPGAPALMENWVVGSVPNDEITKQFEGWSEFRTIVKHVGDAGEWSLHQIDPALEHYVRDGVVLVGDAAHASTPFLGAGASQGLDDIIVLKDLLTHPQTTRTNVHRVLQAYDRVRPARAANVVSKSRAAGRVLTAYPDVSENKIRSVVSEEVVKIYNLDINAEVEAAVRELREEGSFNV